MTDYLKTKLMSGNLVTQLNKLMDEYYVLALRELIGNLVEMAYLAGANGLNITQSQAHESKLACTGEVLTKARIYAKDKGLRT